jgi:hypothetical protein
MGARLDLRTAALTLCALLLVGWGNVCLRYGVDLPFMDQWERPLVQIEKLLTGEHLSFLDDFWPQHNEGRKVVPTAISLALAAALGRYDVHAELGVGFALWVAVAWAVARLARAARMVPPAGAVLALLYLAASGSSRTTYFHLYSVTFERLIPELALLGSLAFVTARGLNWGTAALSAALLAAGQYSFPGAVACWLLVPTFALACRPRFGPWLLLVGSGVLSSLAYFVHYQTPAHHTPLSAGLSQPLGESFRFSLRFLGNPFSGDARTASFVAAATLAALIPLSWLALRRSPRAALAWMTLAAYSISQALLATITRLPMGGNSMRGDYVVHAVYLYVAAAALLLIAWPARVLARAVALAAMLSLLGLLRSDVRADLRWTRDTKLTARRCLVEDPAACDPHNPWLNHPGLETVRAAAMRARRLRVWGL